MKVASGEYLNQGPRRPSVKVAGLRNLAKTNIKGHPSAIHHAFARHHIYNPNKYSIAVLIWYTIQYSKYVKKNYLRLLLFEVAKVSLAVLVAKNKLRCDVKYT